MTTIIYDGSRAMRAKLHEYVESQVELQCQKFSASLIVALDESAVRKHQLHPGVYCSKNPEHFFEMHKLRE
jgi:hypothetical protein